MFKNSLKVTAFVSTVIMSLGICGTVKVNAATVNGNVNIRQGASTEYKVMGQLEKFQEVEILSKSNDWYKVKSKDDVIGWSHSKYIDATQEELKEANDTNSATVKETANFRKGPSTTYSIITTLKAGDKVKVISSQNGWYKLECSNGKVGWTYSSHIDTTSSQKQKEVSTNSTASSSAKKSAKKSGKTMIVSATAYYGDTITSTGKRPKSGRTIAVDPRVIPYGSRVYIPKFGKTFIAEDCGGGIKGKRIDIFMNSRAACNKWGVRRIKIKVLR